MPRRSHLRSLLEALVPADDRENRHRARILQLLEASAEPFSRHQYEPGHITTSAFVLDPARRNVLLIFHEKFERWLQPGGHVEEADADALASARREVHEETGLSELVPVEPSLLDVDVHAIPARADQPAHEHFDVRFLFRSAELRASAGSDARDVRWVPIAQLLAGGDDLSSTPAGAPRRLGPSRYPSDESVMRALRKLEHRSFR